MHNTEIPVAFSKSSELMLEGFPDCHSHSPVVLVSAFKINRPFSFQHRPRFRVYHQRQIKFKKIHTHNPGSRCTRRNGCTDALARLLVPTLALISTYEEESSLTRRYMALQFALG